VRYWRAALFLWLLAVFGSLAVPLIPTRAIAAQDAVTSARGLLAAWHEDPARIDRARALLEAAVATGASAETLIELSRAWFLTGEFRAQVEAERVAAYERGSEIARRAIAAAPRNDRTHLWLVLNTGRTAELKGVVRAVALVSTIREESEIILKLNPSSADGLIVAASLAAEMPALLGGDRNKAEALFKRALEVDPHQTGGRLELARFYVNARRWRDAQRELQHIVDESAPTDLPRWTVSERPRARAMLIELYDRGRVTGTPPQSP
jgi:tetratricopeptide (TPR) repeat protein